MALQVSGHRTEDTSQGPQIGQITYHLEDTIRKLWEYPNLKNSLIIQCRVLYYSPVPSGMQIGLVKVLEIQMLDNLHT